MKHLLISLLLVWPTIMLAAPGDFPTGASYSSGELNILEILLCDGAPSTCTEIDLQTGPAGATSWPGLPKAITYEVRADNCTDTVEGNIVGRSASGGTSHTLLSVDLGVLPSSITLPFSHRYIAFAETGAGAGGACDDFEVVLRLIYDRVTGG